MKCTYIITTGVETLRRADNLHRWCLESPVASFLRRPGVSVSTAGVTARPATPLLFSRLRCAVARTPDPLVIAASTARMAARPVTLLLFSRLRCAGARTPDPLVIAASTAGVAARPVTLLLFSRLHRPGARAPDLLIAVSTAGVSARPVTRRRHHLICVACGYQTTHEK